MAIRKLYRVTTWPFLTRPSRRLPSWSMRGFRLGGTSTLHEEIVTAGGLLTRRRSRA
jgi:hypothetical protein